MKNTIYNVNSDNSCTMNISTQSMKRTELRSLSLSKGRSKRHSKGRKLLTLNSSLLTVLFCLMLGGKAWGQTLDAYSFSTGTGGTTYTPTFTQIIASGKDDEVSSVTDIGFTFKYDGVEYTKFSANSNGRIRLGSTAITNEFSPPFTNTSEIYKGNPPKIVAVGRDCSTGNAGYVKTGLYGSSGSYVRVIEFKLHNTSASSGTTYVRFQIQLFEGTNEIRFVYFEYSNAPSTYQIGIGNANYNKFWYVNPSSHSASYSTTYTSATYNVHPGVGRYYSFRPPYVTPSATAVCAGSSYTIKANGGSTYQWQYKTIGGSWTNLGTFSSSAAAPIYNSYSGGKSQTLNVTAHSNIEIALQWRCYINNSYYTDPVTINVYSAPSAGTISGTTPINVGNSAQFTVTGNSTTGSWSSGNSNYLTVTSSGLVSAVAAGSTSIYYTVSKPSAPSGCNSAQASYAVTVPSCSSVNPPTNIQATAVYQGVNLSWDAAENASSYIVYYGTNGNYNLNKAASGTTCSITGLTPGTQYNFKVMSVGDGTTYCENNTLSSAVTATPLDRTVTVSGNTVCSGDPNGTTLTATATGFGNTAKYSWSASPSSGAGLPQNCTNLTTNTITVAPTAGGNYTYTCTVTEEGNPYSLGQQLWTNDASGALAESGTKCYVIKTESSSITVLSESKIGGSSLSSPLVSTIGMTGKEATDALVLADNSNSTMIHYLNSGTPNKYTLGWYIPSRDDIYTFSQTQNGISTLGLVMTTQHAPHITSTTDGSTGKSFAYYSDGGGVHFEEGTSLSGTGAFLAKDFEVTPSTVSVSAFVTLNIPQSPTVSNFPTSSVTACGSYDITPSISNTACSDVSWAWSGDGSGSGSGTSVTQYTASTSGTYTFTATTSSLKQYDMITQNGISAIVVVAPTMTTDGKAVPIGTGGIGANATAGNVADGALTNLQEAIKVNGGETYSGNREGFVIPAGAAGGVCQSTASVSVTINTPPTLTYNSGSTSQTVCKDNAITDITYSYSEGSSDPVVSDLPTGVTYTANAGVLTISGTPTATGTFSYTVSMTATSPCSAPSPLTGTIKVNALPTPTISQANNYTELTCSRTSITLTANGSDGTFAWSGGGTDATNTVSSAGTYTVTETKNGCSGTSDEYTITSNTTAPTVSVTGTNEICLGVSTTLQTTSNANYTYSWSNGITTSDNEVTPSATIEYTVTTTDRRNGCQTTGSRTVTVNTPDIPNASSYDYIWRGATSTNWNVASNWYVYNSGYSVASSMPGDVKDYYIGTGDCISGSNSPSLNADATVKNLTIYGRSLSIPENKTLNIKGNVSITNNGTISAHNNSTVVFNGTSAQTLSGEMALGKVTFNNASGVTLNNDVTVNSLATFTSGIVNGNMTFETSASSADASYTSHVNGTVTKKGNGSSFIFPTGNDNVLGSIQASVETGKTVSVQFRHNSAGFSESEMPRWWNSNDNCEGNETRFDHVSNFEYWKVNTTSALSAIITVSAETETEHFNSEATTYNIGDIFAAMWQGCWNNVGGGTGSVSVTHDTIIVSGIEIPAVSTRASEPQWLTLGSKSHSTLLPIELLSFTATCDGRSSLVEWTTATEKNNDYFSLERSDDAVNFVEVARVAGAGNSIEPIDYAYTDYGIHGGDNYYRLVQVDYDGTRTVSEVVVVNCIEPEVGEPDVQAYPNPFSNDLTVVLDNFGNRAATIDVYDMLGKLIYTDKVAAPQNYYETILNLSNLPPAAYTVRVSTNDFVINRNVVKQ